MPAQTSAPRAVAAAAPSARAAVERGFLIAAIVWQGGWLLADAELRTAAFSGPSALLFAISGATWLALIAIAVSRRGSRVRDMVSGIDSGLLLVGALVMVLEGVEATQAISMLNLAVGVTALLLPGRIALPVIASSIVVLAVALAVPGALGLADPGMPAPVLGPLYSACIAAAAGAGRALALASAERTDAERSALERASAQADTSRAIEERMLALERRLHESVLNTLTAIAVGGVERGPSLTARCREAAGVIASISGDVPIDAISRRDLRHDIGAALAAFAQLDCETDVRIDRALAVSSLPDDAYAAVTGAAREALANAARHSGATRVRVTARNRRGGIEIAVVDNGGGFDPGAATGRFGVERAIVESMSRAGGTASVTSAPGEGTTVRVSWVPPAPSSPLRANALVVPVLSAIGTYAAVALVLSIGNAERPWADALALAVAAAGGALLLRRGAATLPTWRVLAVAAAVPVSHRLQQFAHAGGPLDDWTEWSSAVGLALLYLLIATGPWWAWVPALAGWLIAMGDPLGELLRSGTMIIVASALFARTIRRSAADAARWQAERRAEDAAAALAAAGTDRIRERYRVLRDSSAPTLLESIASGAADPRDPRVRAACADEERFVRSAMRLDPGTDALHGLAAELVAAARERSLTLEFDVAGSSGVIAAQLAPVRVACLHALAHADAGEPARFTARIEGESMVVRLVVEAPGMPEPAEPWEPGLALLVDGTAIIEARFEAPFDAGSEARLEGAPA